MNVCLFVLKVMEGPVEQGFRQSARTFLSSGRKQAQFIGVVLVAFGGAFALGSRLKSLEAAASAEAELRRTQVEALKETLQAQVGRARAEAIQETSEKFLMYGYAEEYAKFQKKTLASKNEWTACRIMQPEEEEIKSFQPHQADLTTYKQECMELVCLAIGTTDG
jgi:hypothetical protein